MFINRINTLFSTRGLIATWLLVFAFSTMAQEEIIIKALVDGPSELIITKEGFQWKNGSNAKPGRHDGKDEPTYVNETLWFPQWSSPDERGADSSQMFPYPVSSMNMEFELLAIGDDADAKSIEPRTAPAVSYGENAIIVNIADPEAGSKWYVFALLETDE